MYNGDVLVHIDDALDDEARNRLLREMGEMPGVIGAHINARVSHLMVVYFDAIATKPSAILHTLRQSGLGAVLIGF